MQNDILNLEDLTENVEARRASAGKRFGNYIIDIIMFYIIVFVIATLYYLLFPAELYYEETTEQFNIADQIISLILFAVYMGILETVMKGRSFGKLITRTRAVNLDGSPISAKTAFLRGFSRAVPFCAFSALGSPCNPWQDRWTDTIVVTS